MFSQVFVDKGGALCPGEVYPGGSLSKRSLSREGSLCPEGGLCPGEELSVR